MLTPSSHDSLFPSGQDILRVLFRHRYKAAAFFIVTMAVMFIGVMICPRQYVSQGQLFVKLGRETVGLDPTATTGSTISMLDSRESEINSVAEMLRSRELLEHVVDVVGPDVVLKNRPKKEEGEDTSGSDVAGFAVSIKDRIGNAMGNAVGFLGEIGLADPIPEREKAINKLVTRLDVEVGKKSSVIELEMRARSPEEAQQMLEELLAAYNDQHLRVNRTSGSYQFFSDQAERLQNDLDKARDAVREAKSELGLVTVTGQQRLLEEEQRKLELDHFQVLADLKSVQNKIKEIDSLMTALPTLAVSTEVDGHPNNAADGMRQKLYELEVELKELLAKNTEDHPAVQIARNKLAEAQAIYGLQTNERTQRTRARHSGRQKLEEELLLAKAEAAALNAKKVALDEQMIAVQERAKALNAGEKKLAELKLEAERLESNYRSYWQSREQANIDQLLEDERISNVNVSQKPSYMPKPVSPPKMVIGILTLGFATCGAIALAFLCDFLDDSIKTPVEAERQLGLPVLVSIPKSSRYRFKPVQRERVEV